VVEPDQKREVDTPSTICTSRSNHIANKGSFCFSESKRRPQRRKRLTGRGEEGQGDKNPGEGDLPEGA